MALPGALLSGGGQVLQGFGALASARGQNAMYMYKSGVAQANATVANLQASYDEEVGGIKTTEEGLKGADIISRTKTAFGAGNIAVGSGSAAKVQGSELQIAQTNEKVAMSDADHAAYNERIRAATSTAEAGADVAAAKTSTESGNLDFIGSMIGAAGNVASKWAAPGGPGGN